ncbi:hypothetical protein C0992_007289 [Termitomyces sp. T32_za158]|nr:hypothetical protein C0992_007289 [Termitomyces sp. T32_za158]
MVSKEDVRKALKCYIWGQSPLPQEEDITGPLKAKPDTVMSKAFKEAVLLFDYCIPPFCSSSTSASSSNTSKAAKNIPQGQQLTEIRYHGLWMKTLVDWCMDQLPKDPLKTLETKHQEPIKAPLYSGAYGPSDTILERAEAETNNRTKNEIDMANYVLKGPGFLAVSNWCSIDPAHAQQLLEQLYPRDHLEDPFLVEQGNPVLENMALYMLHHDLGINYWLDEHLRSMSPNHFPSARRIRDDPWATLGNIVDMLLELGIIDFIGHLTLCINGLLDQFLRNHLQSARMSDLRDDIWTTFCDIFSGKIYKSIKIGTTSFIGYLTSYDKDLEKSFGFFTPGSWTLPLKETAVWSNGKWVVKKVTTKERSAMEDLHGLYGIVPLGGIFHVTVGWHKGTDFLFTQFKGKPVEDISNGRVRTAVGNALHFMHQKSWHHHDVHEGNVLEDDDGEITLIDFDFAVRAHECLDPDQCPDAPYLCIRKSDA